MQCGGSETFVVEAGEVRLAGVKTERLIGSFVSRPLCVCQCQDIPSVCTGGRAAAGRMGGNGAGGSFQTGTPPRLCQVGGQRQSRRTTAV